MNHPPSRKWFEHQVRAVLDQLPPSMHRHLVNLVVDVEEEPDEQTLLDLGLTPAEIAEGESLFGLYEPLFAGSGLDSDGIQTDSPKRIRIFTGPLLNATESIQELRHEIWMTVVHELAHHFGWSERDLEAFEEGLENPSGIFHPPDESAD